MRTALIAGSTGLVGKSLLQKLLDDPYYDRVVTFVRRSTGHNQQKLREVVVNFDRLRDYQSDIKGDDIFCCLGTTMKQAGSKEAFKKVDYDYSVELATLAHENGAKGFFIVSALGADPKSSFYYNQVKGNVEEAVTKISFESLHIFRPSLLLGPRKESRPGEDAAKTFYRLFNFLIPLKYKAIEAESVANAMLHFAKRNDRGTFVHTSAEMQQLRK